MVTDSTLRDGVRQAYTAVGQRPDADHPFAVGRAFAEGLGYPAEILDRLPAGSVEAFTGVSTVSLLADLPAGAKVLDVGCGAGLDTLIAAERIGPEGQVTGIDFSASMLRRARQSILESGLENVVLSQAAAEALPLPDGSIDVALVNGIFNLNPARAQLFAELGRVVKAGGAVFAAELILREPGPVSPPESLDDWFA